MSSAKARYSNASLILDDFCVSFNWKNFPSTKISYNMITRNALVSQPLETIFQSNINLNNRIY